MSRTYEEKYAKTIEIFSDFNARNDGCDYCPFFRGRMHGSSDEGCFCEDILKLLKRGQELEKQYDPDWRVQHG